MGKLQYHLNPCSFFNNDQWLTIVECCFFLYHPNRYVNYNITHNFPQYYNITHFKPFTASHATVQWRQWYPVQYQSPKLTNSLLSPWPLSLGPHQEQPRLYTIASRKMRKEQTLAGHNYVWLSLVSLSVELECTHMMCSMFEHGSDSIVHKN